MLFFSFEKGPNGQMLLRFLPFYKNIPHSAKFPIPSHWGKNPPTPEHYLENSEACLKL